MVFDSGLLLFVADELLDRNAGSARKPDRMAEPTQADGSGGCSRFRTAVQLTKPAQSFAEHDQFDDSEDYFVELCEGNSGTQSTCRTDLGKILHHHQVLWKSGVRLLERFVRCMRQIIGLPEDGRLSRLGGSVSGRATSPAKAAKIE